MTADAPDQPTEQLERPATQAAGDGQGDGRPDARPPQLAEGIELIGEYADSGYKEPPSIARRADGQIVQLPKLLYFVAESVDGRRGYAEIAERVSEASGRGVSDDNVEFLVDEKLRPLGIVASADGRSPALAKADPLLALKFRVALVSETAVRRITTLFVPFFWPPVVAAALAALIVFDVWFFFFHGVAQSARSLVYNPLLIFLVLGAVVVATAFHEIGHATAARYGGARPGVMGAGIYIVWPAFYTDVTDAYRLDRKGRLRTDLGGVYFNAIFALATAGVYLATRFEPLLVIVLVQHFQILQQMLPFLRLDGYYILSDLTGVPDLFQRIRPTLRSMLPWNREERAEELKRWVRVVVTGWVVLLVPVLLLVFGSIAINAPRIFATAWDSFFVHLDEARAAFNAGKLSTGFVGTLQMATLVLPAVGMSYSSSRAGTRAFRGAWRWSEGAPARRLGVVSGTACLLALLGWVWYPNGDYKPIQPGERGTIPGAVRQLAAIPTGRPGLTPERERELGGAGFRKDSPATGGTDTTDEGPVTGEATTAETTTSGTATTSETATSTTTNATTTSATTTTTATEPTTTTTP